MIVEVVLTDFLCQAELDGVVTSSHCIHVPFAICPLDQIAHVLENESKDDCGQTADTRPHHGYSTVCLEFIVRFFAVILDVDLRLAVQVAPRLILPLN